jgi:hypothetical protein
MAFDSFRDFVNAGELKRISQPVAIEIIATENELKEKKSLVADL